MIKSLTISNFKSFKELDSVPLSNINLLTGANGRGKSSFLQALLICSQSLEWPDQVVKKMIFNGTLVSLGTFADVKNVSISTSVPISFNFVLEDGSEHVIALEEDDSDDSTAKLMNPFPESLNFLEKVHFIAADRVGPQLFYKRQYLGSFLSVGAKGEFVGNILYQKREELVPDHLYFNKEKTQELQIQIGEWVGEILDTDQLRVNVRNVGNGIIILSFQFGGKEQQYKPSNVGFGYSYMLPIVVAGLVAKPGETLIIENPEAHLHPLAQSKLIQFLAKVSKGNVQIFIESHSEHILNALRIQVAMAKHEITASEVSVLFFQESETEHVVPISIDDDGGIDVWPSKFFDQTDKDLKTILGFEG